MNLQNIRLMQFKNYQERVFTFSEGINCIIGENGIGKTNLLDAIYYLAFTKSAFNSVDKDNVLHHTTFFSLKGKLNKLDTTYDILCAVRFGEKKMIKWNGAEYEKISDHIGKIPLVLIAPQDASIIEGGSELRRKFFDNLLSQLDHTYLDNLIKYNQLLKQRNALLKRFSEQKVFQADQIEPYDLQLSPLAIEISAKRNELMNEFFPVFEHYYQELSQGKETVSIQYKTTVGEGFFEVLREKQREDSIIGRTTAGIHKDDFSFRIKETALKKFGSQGQQKSFLIALKLAQFSMIKNKQNIKPILLLDDIFDKLDDQRIAYLLKLMENGTFGQVFITDARPERSKRYMQEIEVKANFLELE